MKAVITVTGKDKVGIIAEVSAECSKFGANIVDISQSVMREYFAMIMIVDITALNTELAVLAKESAELGKQIGMSIYVQHEDVFNAMHNI